MRKHLRMRQVRRFYMAINLEDTSYRYLRSLVAWQYNYLEKTKIENKIK